METIIETGWRPGLENVVAAETALSGVDGERGELIICGYPVEELAPNATFEETIYLLRHQRLPNTAELNALRHALATKRTLPEIAISNLRAAAKNHAPPMDALRMTLSILSSAQDEFTASQADDILAKLPTAAAAYARLSEGEELIRPHPDLGHAANYLYMLSGEAPSPERVRALETYLNTVVDHGLNASTFTARVIRSTGSDLVSSVVGAIGALKGPLHGGAPGPALDMVFEIGSDERIEPYLRAKLARGERLMGFGHRIYRVRDPRADVLAAAAERLYTNGGDLAVYTLARQVEEKAVALLAEYRPERRLQTNVEFYTALLLHGIGLPTTLFTPTFAISRAAGWLAHCLEQDTVRRIFRPQSVYTGPRDWNWATWESR